MGDETKAQNSQEEHRKYRNTPVDAGCPRPATQTQNMKEFIQSKDAGNVMDIPDMEQVSRDVGNPIGDSDNTNDLFRYNSADSIRQAIREINESISPSNFDEDATTSKQQPKNSKDKGADTKSLRKMRSRDVSGKIPLKRPGSRAKRGRKKMPREDFYKGKLSNVVFRSYQSSSASGSEIDSIGSSSSWSSS